MNSGTFHVAGQEWRYFSREKSIIHTLHLAQLATGTPGATVLIMPTAPAGNQNGFSIPPLQLPPMPYYSAAGNIITDRHMVFDCYGAVNWKGDILAQNKMSIHVNFAGDEITMTPQESGYFIVHVEGQTDQRTLGYQGPNNDGQGQVQIVNAGAIVAQATRQLYMAGGDWAVKGQYLDTQLPLQCEALLQSGPFIGRGFGLGNHSAGDPTQAYISMWAFKMANYA